MILLIVFNRVQNWENLALKYKDFICENTFHEKQTQNKQNANNFTYAIKDFPKLPLG